jgi:hypothetical protein
LQASGHLPSYSSAQSIWFTPLMQSTAKLLSYSGHLPSSGSTAAWTLETQAALSSKPPTMPSTSHSS